LLVSTAPVPTETSTLSLHDALPISDVETADILARELGPDGGVVHCFTSDWTAAQRYLALGMYISFSGVLTFRNADAVREAALKTDRKSTRLNSSHLGISYAVFCLKK